jgi:hypothetical protein
MLKKFKVELDIYIDSENVEDSSLNNLIKEELSEHTMSFAGFYITNIMEVK